MEWKSVEKYFQTRSLTVQSFEKIPGDASTRSYYRIQVPTGSFILMQMEPFSDVDLTPFLHVQEHMQKCGILVPKVQFTQGEKGLILLEDLGDITFLRRLQSVSDPNVERQWYQRVIDQLIHMQLECSPEKHPGKDLCSFKMRFDEEKLGWEVNFTIDNFYLGYLDRKISDHDMNVIKNSFEEICRTLANEPTYFTHRDFHSRNLMVTDSDDIYFIDFQDARLGPVQYDLVSLLRDSYYQLDEAQIRKLLDYYMARFEALTARKIDRERFIRVFDLMAIQRNFKAIGSFSSFWVKRNDARYLKFIGNTFENIRRTLLKYPQYSELREILFHYYYF